MDTIEFEVYPIGTKSYSVAIKIREFEIVDRYINNNEALYDTKEKYKLSHEDIKTNKYNAIHDELNWEINIPDFITYLLIEKPRYLEQVLDELPREKVATWFMGNEP